jgi:hypothetical protein
MPLRACTCNAARRTGRRRDKDPWIDVNVPEPARTGTPYVLVRNGAHQMLFALSRLDPPVAPPKTGKADWKSPNQQRQEIV